MDYVFGTVRRNGHLYKRLTTKDKEHSRLSGYVTIVRKYPDNEITDSFKVVEHYKAAKDGEGNCYDFYIIEEHYRSEDKFTPQKKLIQETMSDADAMAIDHELRLTLLELGVK